jgi:glutathione S-transferase
MAPATRIIGNYLSPYVRKVLVALELKQVPYEIDPIVPFFGDERFAQMSPLRRVPVLVDEEVTLCDSSVICQYLDEKYPSPPLYPSARFARAQARWLEEYADTRLGDVMIWRLYNEIVISRFVWGKSTSKEVVERTKNVELPEVLDHLEAQLPAEGHLYGQLSIADISIAAFFRNLDFARVPVDAERWPRTVGYVARILALPPFAALRAFEELSMKTPIPQQREALRAAGAPISDETLATAAPRPGPMTIGF